MPISNFRSGWRALTRALPALLVAASVSACSNESLLEVRDPDLIDPNDVNSVEGAIGLYRGALERFRDITGGEESTWLFGGLLADEWSTSSTFVQNDETDQRRVKTDNSIVTDMFRDLHQVRTATNQAIQKLNEFAPTRTRDIAEMYFARGFAEMQLAQDFCNGIPLTDASGPTIVYGQPLTVAKVFETAVASYDSALALVATATDTASVTIRRAARIGKARALMGLDRYQEAEAVIVGNGTAADAIPTTFAYLHTFAVTSGSNILWSQPASSRRYTVGDSLEGNARNIPVANAIPFFTAQDPRLPVRYTVSSNGRDTTRSQDGSTFSRTTTLYGRTTSVAVVNGIDARLIQAEAALERGDVAGMLAILNALRAAPPRLGDIQPPALPPLTDPGTPERRIDLLFREKAFWTFTRGQRLGDMRRLIRQYGRLPQNVFPEGQHFKGGTYGPDVNFPVPQEEENNPNFSGCLDRNA